MGSHDELLAGAGGGAYAALIQLQEAQEQQQEGGENISPIFDNDIIQNADVRKSVKSSYQAISHHRSSPSSSPRRSSNIIDLPQVVRKSNNLGDSNRQQPLVETSYKQLGDIELVQDQKQLAAAEAPRVPSFRRLIALNKPEWKQGLLGLSGAIGFGFVQPAYAYILGDMIGAFYANDPHKLRQDVKIYCAVFMVLAVSAFSVNLLQHYNFAAIGEYLTKRIRVRMFANILRNEVGWYDRDENSSGSVCARLSTDANTVISFFKNFTPGLSLKILQNIFHKEKEKLVKFTPLKPPEFSKISPIGGGDCTNGTNPLQKKGEFKS
jgi:ATP-binding cassette subfamily B (MDR/TAP) protein 1